MKKYTDEEYKEILKDLIFSCVNISAEVFCVGVESGQRTKVLTIFRNEWINKEAIKILKKHLERTFPQDSDNYKELWAASVTESVRLSISKVVVCLAENTTNLLLDENIIAPSRDVGVESFFMLFDDTPESRKRYLRLATDAYGEYREELTLVTRRLQTKIKETLEAISKPLN